MKTEMLLSYGSEEESETEDGISQILPMPRAMRMVMDEDVQEGPETDAVISFEWPPQLAQPSTVTSSPAPPAPAAPAPAAPSPVALSPAPPALHEPTFRYRFDWRGFPASQIEPNLRREPFSQINSGPVVSFAIPYEAFIAIWDREIVEQIVRETKKYTQQLAATMLQEGTIRPNSRITYWQDTNVNEIYMYLALVLAMGLMVKSRIEEYWNMSFSVLLASRRTCRVTGSSC